MHARKTLGFTLIEVLVAISVLSIMIGIPISIIGQHLVINAQTEESVHASLLAQEVIEYVRHRRDANFLGDTTINGTTIDVGTWFTHVGSRVLKENEFKGCVMTVGEWLRGTEEVFCQVKCLQSSVNGTATDTCSTGGFDGFVAGVDSDLQTRTSSDGQSCDGSDVDSIPEGEVTATLTVVVPDTKNAWYATIRPCVSWKDNRGIVRRVERVETVYEWVVQ